MSRNDSNATGEKTKQYPVWKTLLAGYQDNDIIQSLIISQRRSRFQSGNKFQHGSEFSPLSHQEILTLIGPIFVFATFIVKLQKIYNVDVRNDSWDHLQNIRFPWHISFYKFFAALHTIKRTGGTTGAGTWKTSPHS